MKRDWYIAVCDTSGEFAGNPASFEAATIYGPYTREQAGKAEDLGEEFPNESWTVVVFKAEERPPFRSLIKLIKHRVAAAVAEWKERDEYQAQFHNKTSGEDE
jgi:hypothetical protein